MDQRPAQAATNGAFKYKVLCCVYGVPPGGYRLWVYIHVLASCIMCVFFPLDGVWWNASGVTSLWCRDRYHLQCNPQ